MSPITTSKNTPPCSKAIRLRPATAGLRIRDKRPRIPAAVQAEINAKRKETAMRENVRISELWNIFMSESDKAAIDLQKPLHNIVSRVGQLGMKIQGNSRDLNPWNGWTHEKGAIINAREFYFEFTIVDPSEY